MLSSAPNNSLHCRQGVQTYWESRWTESGCIAGTYGEFLEEPLARSGDWSVELRLVRPMEIFRELAIANGSLFGDSFSPNRSRPPKTLSCG